MKKRFLIALVLLLLLSTYNVQNNFSLFNNLNISEIIVENNLIVEEKRVKKKLDYLYQENLFLLNLKKIETKINDIDFIESFEIKKIYPNKIKIKIFEKTPIVILQNKKEKKYFTNKEDTINFFELDKFEGLPIVFGDKKNFQVFYNDLKNINFPISEIKVFYLFESKRWDLVTNNNQTIKLPIKNYIKSLQNFVNLKNQSIFQKYKIFDYRISDQLILK